jgi:molybdate transport system ATP-binding protein
VSPTECGKTTVLRCIAGLNQLSNGYCAVDNDIWQDHATFGVCRITKD